MSQDLGLKNGKPQIEHTNLRVFKVLWKNTATQESKLFVIPCQPESRNHALQNHEQKIKFQNQVLKLWTLTFRDNAMAESVMEWAIQPQRGILSGHSAL